MPSLAIIKSGLMTSIQDHGRKGWMYYAIPRSGAMDNRAAQLALKLLGKASGEAVIECTSIAPHILFHQKTLIAITGADFDWSLEDKKVVLNQIIEVEAGAILRGKIAKNGLRGYLAIQGKVALEQVYDSYSTYQNARIGGFQGRFLQKGDVLKWEGQEGVMKGSVYENSLIFSDIVPIQKGPEFDHLTPLSESLLLESDYKISAESNRMGVRLQGTPLTATSYQLKHSLPVLPGFVQLPPSGLPIIILQDGQISGGYPRIAYVRGRDLSLLNQIPLAGHFRFMLE
ncbi:MAG: biotin-dependent carboxyltransferase family protein [Bacteroidota bacterium]